LRLAHRQSVDFDFFAVTSSEPRTLLERLPYLKGAALRRSAPDTLTVTVDRGGPVQLFFSADLLWDPSPLRRPSRDQASRSFLIHDRDSRYGANFDRRVRGLEIRRVRTPVKSPRANAVAERWVRSVRSECLDYLIVFNEANLRRVLSAYVTYFNRGRPHRSLGQAVPCGEATPRPRQACRKIAAEAVLGGLHHIYRAAG
jgi:hypothetical protein